MNAVLWAIPNCFLGFAIICLAIASYKAGKKITALDQDVKMLKEKTNL